MRQVPATTAPAETEGLPPTIRIHMPGDRGAVWERRPPLPPPLPATAAPAVPVNPSVEPAAPPPTPEPAAPPVPASPAAPPLPAPPEEAAPPVAPARPEAPAPVFAEPFYESDVAPTLPTAQAPEFGRVDEPAQPTLPPGAMAAEETVFEPEPPEPAPAPAAVVEAPAPEPSTAEAATPLSSSTLAELYLRQGLPERAIEVYRQLLSEEPGNERARARLVDIQSSVTAPDPRAARRRALERTIAGLESLLAALQRR